MKPYKLQTTSVWDFPDRGSWATHKGDYRGNWSPHIPRNLILKYTKQNDFVLDCFLGSGTTSIECKILNRNSIGIDINPQPLCIAKKRLDFNVDNSSKHYLFLGNATHLTMLKDQCIDFICTHPPYANIIKYSNNLDGDLSLLGYQDFLLELKKVADELHRVLKEKHFCSFMIGDIRIHGNVIPLGFLTMQVFQDIGFTLKEIIIKKQHNCTKTKYWQNKNYNFYLLAHEYIFIFQK